MPSTVPTSAIRRPIAPRPMTPSRLPRSSKPSYPSRMPHAPRLTARSSSVSRRASASISISACSLTACVVRPGACTTATPAALAATVSMLSSPAPHRPTTWTFGSRRHMSAVIRPRPRVSTARTSSSGNVARPVRSDSPSPGPRRLVPAARVRRDAPIRAARSRGFEERSRMNAISECSSWSSTFSCARR